MKFKKLTNTRKNRELLEKLLRFRDGEVDALIELGFFKNRSPKSYSTIKLRGLVTDIDMSSGLCSWEYSCDDMPEISINSISIASQLGYWKYLYKEYFDINLRISKIEEKEGMWPIIVSDKLTFKLLQSRFKGRLSYLSNIKEPFENRDLYNRDYYIVWVKNDYEDALVNQEEIKQEDRISFTEFFLYQLLYEIRGGIYPPSYNHTLVFYKTKKEERTLISLFGNLSEGYCDEKDIFTLQVFS